MERNWQICTCGPEYTMLAEVGGTFEDAYAHALRIWDAACVSPVPGDDVWCPGLTIWENQANAEGKEDWVHILTINYCTHER